MPSDDLVRFIGLAVLVGVTVGMIGALLGLPAALSGGITGAVTPPLVNLNHVIGFRREGKERLVAELADGTRLAVSRARAHDLRRLGA